MEIALPAPLERDLSPARAALHLAIGLFTAEEVTLGQAAEAAALSRARRQRHHSLRYDHGEVIGRFYAGKGSRCRTQPSRTHLTAVRLVIAELRLRAGCWFDDLLIGDVSRAAGEE